MKIAMLTNNYKPFIGGVPISIERQAEELTKMGHEVTVFAPDYGTENEDQEVFEEDGIQGVQSRKERIIRFESASHTLENGMVYPKLISKKVLRVFEQETFDCIHVHHPMFVGPMALYLGKKHHLPVIYTYHTKYEDYLHYVRPFQSLEHKSVVRKAVFRLGKEKIVPAYMRWFTNQCDFVFAPTAGMQKILRESGTTTATAVFPTGLKDTFFIGNKTKSEAIREKYVQEGEHLFCTVSRLEEEKNPRFILNGIARLKEKLKVPFRVLFIGDGSMREELEEMAKELGISKEAVFLGNVENEEIKYYLGASDLFLFASKSETQGIVLAEAFAAGCPVVAIDATGVEDVVVNGKNGYRTKDDVEEWTEKILETLNEKNYAKFKVQAELTASSFRASRLAVYEELLYAQCVDKKRREGTSYGNEKRWSEHAGASIYRLF